MLTHATALTAFFALMLGDRSQAGTSVSELARIVRDHELPLFRAIGEFLVGWADAEGGALAEGLAPRPRRHRHRRIVGPQTAGVDVERSFGSPRWTSLLVETHRSPFARPVMPMF